MIKHSWIDISMARGIDEREINFKINENEKISDHYQMYIEWKIDMIRKKRYTRKEGEEK